jgi:hypothetical protein
MFVMAGKGVGVRAQGTCGALCRRADSALPLALTNGYAFLVNVRTHAAPANPRLTPCHRMRRALRFTPAQRRTATSTLFAATALAAVLTVAATQAFPCPRRRGRFADADEGSSVRTETVVARRPSRWIEEVHPAA